MRFLLVSILSLLSFPLYASNDISAECTRFSRSIDQLPHLMEQDKITRKSSSHLSRQFIWENDSLANGGDRHYTNGMKLSWLHNPCRHKHPWLKKFLQELVSTETNNTHDTIFTTGGLFGMNMYTPNDLTRSDRIYTDRPYAGWVYGGFQVQAVNNLGLNLDKNIESNNTTIKWVEQSSHTLELQLGFLGPQTAQEQIQKFIHKEIISSAPDPQGWDNQISNHVGFNALYTYRKNLFVEQNYKYFRLTGHLGASVGNVMRFVNTGFILSFGKLGNDYPGTTTQPTTFDARMLSSMTPTPLTTTSNNTNTGSTMTLPALQNENFFYIFAGIDYRYIFYSLFIEGKNESKHTIELVNNVYDFIYGVSFRFNDYKFSYKVIERSKEFNSSDAQVAIPHKFGQFVLEWYF